MQLKKKKLEKEVQNQHQKDKTTSGTPITEEAYYHVLLSVLLT